MSWMRRNRVVDEATSITTDPSLRGRRGQIPTLISGLALLFSGYTLWDNSLKQAQLLVFVPPVIQYAAPYQNSNFEVLAIPVTIANEGAQTGTILSMELEVTDPNTQATKHFYSADFGRWSMEKTRSNAYQPFAPIALEGRGRRTETVLFYPRGEQEKPDQLVHEPGSYRFKLMLDDGNGDNPGWFDRIVGSLGWTPWRRHPPSVSFERELRWYDARAFNNGTLPMYATSWRSATNASSE
jgi:hypothetical protein